MINMSFAAEVIADSSNRWCGNQLRFATADEAQNYVRHLSMRWTAVRDTRVVPSADPVSHRMDFDGARPISPDTHA